MRFVLVLLVTLLAACASESAPHTDVPATSPPPDLLTEADCAEGLVAYATQLGPKCIERYDERLIRSWPQCSRSTQCPSERCVFAARTPEGEPIQWDPMGIDERPRAGFRCVPEEYFEMLLHSSGATYRDEDGEEATVIA